MIEQRRTKRFELKLPVEIVRTGPLPISGHGETRNVCSRGILFASDLKVDIGESLEYLIALPLGSQARESVTLHCLGKVLRFEGDFTRPEDPTHPFQMAATIERYEFVRQ